MKKINKILAAIDLSKFSAHVVKSAVEIAGQLNAPVIFLNVINERDIEAVTEAVNHRLLTEYTQSFSPQAYINELKDIRRERIEELIKKSGHSPLSYQILFRSGQPPQKIMDAVKEEKADLLIIGTKGRTSRTHFLMGSTADKILHHCSVPVLSIRD